MSRAAYNEFLLFPSAVQSLKDEQYDSDAWVYQWSNGIYTSNNYYWLQFQDYSPPAPLSWIWKAKSMPKIKFFAWLLLVGRLNTRDVLRRRNKHLEEGYNCVMCQDQVLESSLHLFFECSSAAARWFALGIQWNTQPDICDMLCNQRLTAGRPFFMDFFMIATWTIWKERNDFIFNYKAPSIGSWKRAFKAEVNLHLLRIPPSKRPVIMN